MGHDADPIAMWNVITGFAKTHVNSGSWENALASQWYSWIVLYHPIVLKLSHSGGVSHYASSIPNPVLFFPVTALMLGLPLSALVMSVRKRWRGRLRDWLALPLAKPVLLLALGWLALLLPWSVMLGKHTFMYHYMPSYGLGLVLLAGCTAQLLRWRPRAALGFLGLAAAMAIYFAPVWGELPLSERAANRRLIFPSWRP
jgi:dolichyl-phosphate-mannose--protein O-mannosyl transferase